MKTLVVLTLVFYAIFLEQVQGRCRPGEFKPKKPTFIETQPSSTSSDVDQSTTEISKITTISSTSATLTAATVKPSIINNATAKPTIINSATVKPSTITNTEKTVKPSIINNATVKPTIINSATVKPSTITNTAKTVKPSITKTSTVSFNPNKDAKVLHETLNGSHVNSSKIIQILTSKTRNQRLEIVNQYAALFHKNLIGDVSRKLSGDFKRLIKGLLTPLTEYYASELFAAVHGPGTNEHCLIDILCILNNQEMEAVKTTYKEMFGETLEWDIKDDTSGDFEDLLVSLIKANRESGFNKYQAVSDAAILLQAGELMVGTDETAFIEILTTRSYEQLRLTFDEYEWLSGHSLEYIINCEFSSDIKDGLLAIVSAVRNLSSYFAERLHLSMAGPGTINSQLTRIMTIVDSPDMPKVIIYYRKNYGMSLWNAIEDDTSGYYKDCLLGLAKKAIFKTLENGY